MTPFFIFRLPETKCDERSEVKKLSKRYLNLIRFADRQNNCSLLAAHCFQAA
ncbi:MAG: hypothetical protein IJV35_00790 [Neisseriaceae bacterium]|nr:hypothetical protein [Neisseriaceae bacterium]